MHFLKTPCMNGLPIFFSAKILSLIPLSVKFSHNSTTWNRLGNLSASPFLFALKRSHTFVVLTAGGLNNTGDAGVGLSHSGLLLPSLTPVGAGIPEGLSVAARWAQVMAPTL